MFNNLLIGRYMPGESWVHRLDARTKLVLSIAFIFVIFFANNVVGYVVAKNLHIDGHYPNWVGCGCLLARCTTIVVLDVYHNAFAIILCSNWSRALALVDYHDYHGRCD